MNVRFWGVRGSIPVPGPTTERYGGNTSCVEVTTGAGTRIVFDAGTGLRAYGHTLLDAGFAEGRGVAHILISHTHWDHVHGLPFFAPLYQRGNKVQLYTRESSGRPLQAVFEQAAVAPAGAGVPRSLVADIGVTELRDDAGFAIGDAHVACARLNHPYVATAYAVTADGAKVVYVTDTAPFSDILFGHEYVKGPPPAGAELPPSSLQALAALRSGVVRLCEGADLVIYDTMFTADDYRRTPHFGHSRPSDALAICTDAGARTLALFHHAPERDDDDVDRMLIETRALATHQLSSVAIIAAYEGLDLPLGRDAVNAAAARASGGRR
ncbi:MAG TPA: MBL fold metallo-hydrolase [Polyangia bacterium]